MDINHKRLAKMCVNYINPKKKIVFMDGIKDKKRITIVDLLKAHKDGLTIQEIVDKTGLARHTVLARLHHLEGEQKVRLRQVNMAKMYYWNEEPKSEKTEPHAETKEKITLTSLKEEHLSKDKRPKELSD